MPSSRALLKLSGSMVAVAILGWAEPSSAQEAAEATGPSVATTEALPEPGSRTKLALAGGGLLGGFWAVSFGSSYLMEDWPGSKEQRYPVAGPWMALGNLGCPSSDPDCSKWYLAARGLFLTLDGLGQAGGVLLLGEALFLPTASPARSARTETLRWRPVPMVSDQGLGLGVIGQF